MMSLIVLLNLKHSPPPPPPPPSISMPSFMTVESQMPELGTIWIVKIPYAMVSLYTRSAPGLEIKCVELIMLKFT